MFHADIARQLLFELGDLRPQNIAALAHNRLDGIVDLVSDAFTLGGEVDKLHGNLVPEHDAEKLQTFRGRSCDKAWPRSIK